MPITSWRASLRPALLSLPIAALSLGATATPSQAGLGDFLNCFFGCYGGGGGGWSGGGGGGGNTDVDPTGVIHTVFIVGDTFFPTRVYAEPGDELKFYNLRNSSIKVQADDSSWNTGWLSRNQSWSMVMQSDDELDFRKSSYGYTSMRGEVRLEDRPSSVDFGDLIDPNGNIIGKDGETVELASGLGYTLAGVSGLLQDVGNGLGGLLGGGLGLGLTNDYGQGNNTN
ncbi:hypothetical protein [Pseudooceanicola onchidii]|uniref:hypothetical protein n=1 Tax=Pseudooceanicola onchidii TaxID=2562279 RepID=UPI0010A9CAD5|nr:hypothetical protein [Pseudooceanicola onchidii]